MLSLDGAASQTTDLHEALAEGAQPGQYFGQHSGQGMKPAVSQNFAWAPPSVSSHSRESSVDSPMWPPSGGLHPPTPPPMGSAFAGAGAARQAASQLQPTWGGQFAAQQSGYPLGRDPQAQPTLPTPAWGSQQLPTPFGNPPSSNPSGYWHHPQSNSSAGQHAGQQDPNQFAANQSTAAYSSSGGGGRYSPDGRPPCAILSFGFGGRAVLVDAHATAPTASAYGFGGRLRT